MPCSMIRMDGVSKHFGDVAAVAGASLCVERGETVALLGPSGCGKSTLLRVVAGFHRPSAGRVVVGDRVVADRATSVPPERRRVGIVPQEGALFPHLTVAENVGFGLRRGGARQTRVDELLELVGLTGLAARRPAELSGGQQQRVAVARALAPGPAVLLLDEPFSSLDAGLRADVRAEMRAALRATGATAVLVTHDQEEALGMADAVAVMRGGRIVQHADPATVYLAPADLGVARFVGETVVLSGRAGAGVVATRLGPLPLVANGNAPTGEGLAVLRPEQLLLRPDPRAEYEVLDIVFHGHDATVHLAARDGSSRPLQARVQGMVPVRSGDRVAVAVHGTALFYPVDDADDPVSRGLLR